MYRHDSVFIRVSTLFSTDLRRYQDIDDILGVGQKYYATAPKASGLAQRQQKQLVETSFGKRLSQQSRHGLRLVHHKRALCRPEYLGANNQIKIAKCWTAHLTC